MSDVVVGVIVLDVIVVVVDVGVVVRNEQFWSCSEMPCVMCV